MATVDTHCHVSLSRFEPVETLLFQMDTYGVDKAVLVQHGGEYDN
jgi:L-fuconolactonase